MTVAKFVSAFVIALAILPPSLAWAKSGTSTSKMAIEDLKPQTLRGEWAMSLGGLSYEQGKDNEAAAFFYGNFKFDYKFAPWLRTHLEPALNVFSSRVQERFDDSGDQSRIWMMDGYVSIEPIDFFQVKAGALNQGYHGNSMLVSGLRSFPGLQEIVHADLSSVRASLIIQQAIPTSHSLNTERVDQEQLPTFMTETLMLSGKHFGWLEWKGSGGFYDWSNIPDKVVSESRLIGNVGTGENVAGSRFLYDHEGWYFSTKACYCSTYWLGAGVEFQRIHNGSAPRGAANAQMFGLGPNIRFGDVELELRVRPYFIESDATVAAYNKGRLGNTNRRGTQIEANLNFKKQGFSIFADSYQATPINSDPNQRDLTIYNLGVETEYAPF